MGDAKSLAHTKWNCKYHIVFAPKYRRQVFYGEKKRAIGEILRKLCEWKCVRIIEAECCPEALLQNRGKRNLGRPFRLVFSSLSAEDADTQAVVFKIPEAVRSSLDEFHFPVEAFGDPVVFREAEHPGNLLLPRIQRAAQ